MPRIDWTNPITAGLFACYVPSATGGRKIPNLTGMGLDLTAESGATFFPSQEGQALTSNAATSGADITGIPVSVRPTSQMTLFWRGAKTNSSGGNNCVLMGISYSSPEGSPFFVNALCVNPGGGSGIVAQWNSSGTLSNGGTATITTTNKMASIMSTISLGGNSYVYVDGALKDTTATSAGTFSYSATSNVNLANYQPVLSRITNANTMCGMMWNRQLSHAEAASISADPYQFLIYPEDEVFSHVQGTGIFFDAASNSGYQAAQSSYSWNHTCTGSNRYLVVGIAMLSLAQSVTSITYAGQDLRLIGVRASITGACRVEMWGIIAPATGSNTIAVTLSGSIASAGCASSYIGVHQSSPIEGFNTAQATNVGAADATVDVTTVADLGMVVDIVATDDGSITVGAGQTQRANVTGAGGSGAMSNEGPKTPAGAVTMSWTNVGAAQTWATAAVALRPMVASGLASKIFRKTLSSLGSRVGNRQTQG